MGPTTRTVLLAAATKGTGQSATISAYDCTSPQYGVFTTSTPISTAQRTAQAISSGVKEICTPPFP